MFHSDNCFCYNTAVTILRYHQNRLYIFSVKNIHMEKYIRRNMVYKLESGTMLQMKIDVKIQTIIR